MKRSVGAVLVWFGFSAAACGVFDFDPPGLAEAAGAGAGGGGGIAGRQADGGAPATGQAGEVGGYFALAGSAGTTNAGGASAGDGGEGDLPNGGSPDSVGGSHGDTEQGSSAVHGKIIDRFGAPVHNASVQIGQAQVLSDEAGAFTIADVAATYELSLLVEGAGWVFQDLTRRDPTLQIYDGRPDRYTYCEVTLGHASRGPNDQISLATGTESGSTEVSDVDIQVPVPMAPDWQGGTTTDGTIYALEWSKDPTSSLPVSYEAFGSKPLSLSMIEEATVTVDMTPRPIASAAVSGLVRPRADGIRNNRAFVQFLSGASIMVANQAATNNAFSYVVPQIVGASVTLMAAEGPFDGPRGLAHKDGLAAGTTGVSIDIPAPPAILTPADYAKNVDQTTPFTFAASADNAGAFVLILHRLTTERQKLYIVTTHQTLTLPSVVGGALTLTAGQNYEWWVETHGSFATVDEMTGPKGFIDEFGYHGSSPNGGRNTDGTLTYTEVHEFTAK